MKRFYSALSWFLGSSFLLSGLFILVVGLIPNAKLDFLATRLFITTGISLIVISLLILPPVRAFVSSRTHIKIPTIISALVIIGLLFAEIYCLWLGEKDFRTGVKYYEGPGVNL